MRILISAGEASGDIHAAAVIQALRDGGGHAEIYGIAGPAMRQTGCQALSDMEQLNVMGVSDVLRSLPRIIRVRGRILDWAAEYRPDVAILVDFPGFHMNLGARLRRLGIPVLQYIAPKLWAWGAWRVKRLRQSGDELACILPFEPEWFGRRGIEARYVGNPSAIACARGWSAAEFRRKLHLDHDRRVLALLPGSRPSELAHHVPLFEKLWRLVRQQRPDVSCVIPVAPGVDRSLLAVLAADGAKLVDRMQTDFSLRADAAVAVSGTATLELALWDVPTVLVYRASALTVLMARKVVRLRHIGLANILLGHETVMPELIQKNASPERIVAELLPLLENGEASRRQRLKFAALRALLGEKNPADEVASMVLDLCRGKPSSRTGQDET